MGEVRKEVGSSKSIRERNENEGGKVKERTCCGMERKRKRVEGGGEAAFKCVREGQYHVGAGGAGRRGEWVMPTKPPNDENYIDEAKQQILDLFGFETRPRRDGFLRSVYPELCMAPDSMGKSGPGWPEEAGVT